MNIAFDSNKCGGQLAGLSHTGIGEQLAIGLTVRNEHYGCFGVIIPANNYQFCLGDDLVVTDGTATWMPRANDDICREFPVLLIVLLNHE
jgi:hypothetical protein